MGRWIAVAVVAAVLVGAIGVGVELSGSGSTTGSKNLSVVGKGSPSASTRQGRVAANGHGGGDKGCNQPNHAAAAEVPANSRAAIFDNFGLNPNDSDLLDEIDGDLHNEGYSVDRFSNPTQGAQGIGTATIDNFVSMAQDCVVVFDTHGFSPDAATTQQVQQAEPSNVGDKAVSFFNSGDGSTFMRYRGVDIRIVPKGDDDLLLAEWWRSAGAADDRYVDLIKSKRYNNDEIALLCEDDQRDPYLKGPWCGIMLTSVGLQDFFHGAGIALVDAIACDSGFFAPYFNASAYFGYDSVCFSSDTNHQATDDSRLLFNALIGNKGLDKRTTTEANSLFNGAFKLASDRQAIALSPAVASIEPADGSQLKPGQTAHVKVTFDSEILAPAAAKDLFQIDDNCGTSKNESLSSDGTTLTFDYVVPSQPKGQTSILTILADKAVGGSGFPNKLDGNTDPPGTDGQAKNGDSYMVKYTCAAGINLFVSGQVAGQQVDGQIGSGAQVTCLPPSSEGSPAIVHWSGAPDKTHNSVSGEFDLKYGTWSPSNAQGASSFQVNNPSLQRVGWTGGTITVSATGGTVDADFTDGPGSVHVRGTWTCSG